MRTPQYEDGRRNGVKACVEWLHAHARTMNDRSARDALNAAAHSMSIEVKPAHYAHSNGTESGTCLQTTPDDV